MEHIRAALNHASDPKHSKWVAPLLLAGDAVLTSLVIWRIPYTEIDWRAYMQQVAIYTKGERNYHNIEGDTGPLVYPGLHVYIYRCLYLFTGEGVNILLAQVLFGILYLVTLAVVLSCYRLAKAPPYILPLLVLSKRLHSIYVLRLFNDCWAALFLWLCLYFYQKKMWISGTAALSCGIGVKMSVLLVVPGVAFVLLQALGLERSITQALLVAQSQGLFAYEFVRSHWRAYISRAFQLNRVFLYKWTVNWRFFSEETFLSKPFSVALLSAHATLLAIFAFTRWTTPSGRSLPDTIRVHLQEIQDWRMRDAVAARIDARYVMTTILTANAIGLLCARSLHYQFYALIAWGTPFLLWRGGLHPVLIYAIWAAQEWSWNVYPSTRASSATVVTSLAIQVCSVWWATRLDQKIRPEKRTHVE